MVMRRRAHVIVPERKKEEPKEKRLGFSGFLLTINTNTAVLSKNDPMFHMFKKVISDICHNMWEFVKRLEWE